MINIYVWGVVNNLLHCVLCVFFAFFAVNKSEPQGKDNRKGRNGKLWIKKLKELI